MKVKDNNNVAKGSKREPKPKPRAKSLAHRNRQLDALLDKMELAILGIGQSVSRIRGSVTEQPEDAGRE